MRKYSRVLCSLVSSLVGFSFISSPSIAMEDSDSTIEDSDSTITVNPVEKPKGVDLLLGATGSIIKDFDSIFVTFKDVQSARLKTDESVDKIYGKLLEIMKKFEDIQLETISQADIRDRLFIFTGFTKCKSVLAIVSAYFSDNSELQTMFSNIQKNISEILNHKQIDDAIRDTFLVFNDNMLDNAVWLNLFMDKHLNDALSKCDPEQKK